MVQGDMLGAEEKVMTLPIDPVCGMEIVDQNAAPQSIYEGDARYFCGEGCKTKFDESPERYSGLNPATP
jgi:YHS domain-containing protein